MPRIAKLELNQINPQIARLDALVKQFQDALARLERVEFILKSNNLKPKP